MKTARKTGEDEDRKPAREGRAPALPKFASNVVSPGKQIVGPDLGNLG